MKSRTFPLTPQPTLPSTLPPTPSISQWICWQDECYHRSYENITWFNAVTYCDEMESTIVSIHSYDQNQYIAEKICRGNCYVGLTDYISEGQFAWIDGTPLDYINWCDGEPNNANGEDAAHMRPDGCWDDANYDVEWYTICMKSVTMLTPTV